MLFLDPRNDIVFKKVFGSEEHKAITISFLNSILEYSGPRLITEIQFLNTEQPPVADKKKDSALVVLCTDQSDNRYIVEIQVDTAKEFFKRLLYYWAKTYVLQLGEREEYYKLKPVIAIAVLDYEMFPRKKHYKSTHQLLDIKTHERDVKDMDFVFIELKKFEKSESELETAEDRWIYFIKQITKHTLIPKPLSDGVFKEACEATDRMRWSTAELLAYDNAKMRDGLIKGQIELALEKGEEQGEAKAMPKVALEMLRKGFDAKTIEQITKLSIEQIQELQTNTR
jgi:predicted transposase/invertase (TIGR01784 family)